MFIHWSKVILLSPIVSDPWPEKISCEFENPCYRTKVSITVKLTIKNNFIILECTTYKLCFGNKSYVFQITIFKISVLVDLGLLVVMTPASTIGGSEHTVECNNLDTPRDLSSQITFTKVLDLRYNIKVILLKISKKCVIFNFMTFGNQVIFNSLRYSQ